MPKRPSSQGASQGTSRGNIGLTSRGGSSSLALARKELEGDRAFVTPSGEERRFPLCLGPDVGDGSACATAEDTAAWLREHMEEVKKLVPVHGAVLLRGLNVPDAMAFSSFVEKTGYEEQPYLGGNAVRRVVAPRVFTANESPPTEKIPFHHEMAQAPDFPTRVMFYCETPSPEGGETPIVLSEEVCKLLREEFTDLYSRFKEEGVKYIRTMPTEDDSESALGRGWKSTYLAKTREEAEEEMKKAGTKWEWLPNGDLRTESRALSAIRVVDGAEVFFNQVIAAHTGWNDSRNTASRAVVFGTSGDVLPAEEMKRLVERVHSLEVAFRWRKGDVLLIDNRRAMHSRRPFVKPRVVLASLAR